MSKLGYVIARSHAETKYFTASSAYDRPQWKMLEEATVYANSELAARAVDKLIKNGSFSAKIVALAELSTTLDPRYGDLEDTDSTEQTGSDFDPESGDEMVASHPNDVCDTCGHEPCTCAGDELDAELDKVDSDLDDISDDLDDLEDELSADEPTIKVTRESAEERFRIHHEGHNILVQELVDGKWVTRQSFHEISDDYAHTNAREALANLKKRAAVTEASGDVVDIKDPAMVVDSDKDAGTTVADANESSVKVPSSVMTSLKDTAAAFDKAAEVAANDDVRASFCMTVANAARTLIADLQLGTVEGLKMAQVHMTSFMSPITSQFSPIVIKYIQSGGAKTSLKNMYDEKWATRRNQEGVL